GNAQSLIFDHAHDFQLKLDVEVFFSHVISSVSGSVLPLRCPISLDHYTVFTQTFDPIRTAEFREKILAAGLPI
ncbi:hypothetical protein, partial [Actimicrobium sp. CCI2.3]|uniref:hypothetical protein n=1 Tax=Actimicrobium sp. CCI2.3 TaxID=3048616 RepID=UPI002B24B195